MHEDLIMAIKDSQDQGGGGRIKVLNLTNIAMGENQYPNVIGLSINALNLEDILITVSGMR